MQFNREQKYQIQEALIAMWACFHPEKEMPIVAQRAYAAALSDLGVDGITRCCAIAMQKCEWLPKPVQLRELLFGSIDEQCEKAWLQVVDAVERHGGYQSIEFDDSRISNAIQSCGGWQTFCEKKETWAKKEFFAAFKNMPMDCKPVRLVGIHDRNNRRYQPKLIGFKGQPRLAVPKPKIPGVEQLVNQMAIAEAV